MTATPLPAPTRRFANIERWGPVNQLLHWLIVVLIIVMAYLGLTMTDLANGPEKIRVYTLHKSIGLTILALVTLRVLWRAWAGKPATLPGPRWQHAAASITHAGLYVLLFAVPLSGWFMNSAAGFPLRWWGLVRMPALVAKDHDLHEIFESMHQILFWALIVVALAHAFVAIWHHLFQRDATLSRMLPNGWLRVPDATQENRDVR